MWGNVEINFNNILTTVAIKTKDPSLHSLCNQKHLHYQQKQQLKLQQNSI